MPRHETAPHPTRRTRRRALWLAAGVCLAAWALPAQAQQSELRGQVSENAVNGDLLGRGSIASRPTSLGGAVDRTATQTETTAPAYRPESAGALSEAEEREASDGLFGAPDATDDTFAAPSPAARPARPEENDEDDAATATQPETDEEATGTVRVEPIDDGDLEANERLETENARIEAIEGRDFEPEANPYAPLGMRAGRFIVTPTLEQGVTYSTNPDLSPGGGEAVLSETTLRLNAISDWSRHSASLDAYGIYRKSLSGTSISELQAGIDGRVSLDLADGWRANAALGYSIRPESATSPVVIPPTVSRPLRHGMTGSAGIGKDIGKLRLDATAAIDRNVYSDADLAGGGVLSQEERNATLASLRLRTGYQVSPALTPFVEGEIGRRFYDLTIDSAGYRRSSDRLGARAGVELDLGEKLGGEFAVGWLREAFDDSRLAPISGLTLDAALNWSPQRGTTVSLTGATSVEGTTTAGDSGSILYSGGIAVTRELRANLTGRAAFNGSLRDYASSSDTETTLAGEIGATWWLNRNFGLTSRLRHEQFTSTLPNRDASASSVYLGVTLQK